jgi:hypothetical protein
MGISRRDFLAGVPLAASGVRELNRRNQEHAKSTLNSGELKSEKEIEGENNSLAEKIVGDNAACQKLRRNIDGVVSEIQKLHQIILTRTEYTYNFSQKIENSPQVFAHMQGVSRKDLQKAKLYAADAGLGLGIVFKFPSPDIKTPQGVLEAVDSFCEQAYSSGFASVPLSSRAVGASASQKLALLKNGILAEAQQESEYAQLMHDFQLKLYEAIGLALQKTGRPASFKNQEVKFSFNPINKNEQDIEAIKKEILLVESELDALNTAEEVFSFLQKRGLCQRKE